MNQHDPIFFTPPSGSMKHRTMHKGGGGDGGASERAAEAERRKLAAIAQVNAIFGSKGGVRGPAPVLADYQLAAPATSNPYGGWGNLAQGSAVGGRIGYGGIGGGFLGLQKPPPPTYDMVAYNKAVAAYALGGRAAANDLLREAGYREISDAVFNFQRDTVDRNRENEGRELGFELARRGQTAGSVDVDQHQVLGELYDRNILNARTAGDAAGTSARTSDERAKLNLINAINAGMDQSSAISSANTSIANNLTEARETGLGQTVSNLMDDASLITHAQRVAAGDGGVPPWYYQQNRSTVPNAGPYSGTVQRG